MEPSNVVDPSFRNLFEKAALKIHNHEKFDEAHDLLSEHFSHLGTGNTRAVYEIPPQIAGLKHPLVVKFALPGKGKSGSQQALYADTYTDGKMANMHEIILSTYDPIRELVVPIIDHHEDGLWVVMAKAETLPNTNETRRKLKPLSQHIEDLDIEFVSHGEETGKPEIYQIKAWGNYQGEVRLRDYGGIVVSDQSFLSELPAPYCDPAI